MVVRLCKDELTIIIGGVMEAMRELGDDEFAIRSAPPPTKRERFSSGRGVR